VEASPRALERLSFDRVLAALAARASTRLGAELAGTLGPHVGPAAADDLHRRTAEVLEGGELSLGGIEDIRPLLRRVREGGMLSGEEILSAAYTLDAVATLRRSVAASNRPALTELAARIGGFDGLLRLVREQLDVDGNVRDDATPKLREIRQRLAPLRGRIKERLARLLEVHAADVQEPIITLRRERYVIPVKASAQSRVPGLALDRSDSGATVFVEPASVVELNNELALLEMEERDEVRRILLALSRRLADEPLVDESLAVVAELDVVNAAARLAKDWRLVAPAFDAAGRVRLPGARHPLVADCVPNDVELDADRRLLVVTGPNAGGKTVLLKTVGLAAVMAHSGLYVAAAPGGQALLPRLAALLADIGDQQSIEASLSTYAGHLLNLREIVERAGPDTLVLIDELGSGTDPDEGAALSQAILERVLRGGARGVVTTHLAPLKVFAGEAEGAVNAAMSFDLDELRPTYRLTVGQPGRSYALAIAERIGLDEELLERASQLLGAEAGRLEGLLAALEEQRAALTAERDEARRRTDAAVAEAALLREQIETLRAREEDLIAAAAARAEELLGETLQQAARLKRAATSQPEQRSRALQELQELRRAAKRAARRGGGEERRADDATTRDPFRRGATVEVPAYGARGRVVEDRGDALLVQLGLVKVEVAKRDARPVAEENAGAGRPTGPAGVGTASFDEELDVRGARVEEALEAVRGFIAEAQALKVGSVRILHGKGTGALRDAIRQELRGTRAVKGFADAVPYEGGHGVTVVELRA
jgi:DNA mismatch repair protein MutS2